MADRQSNIFSRYDLCLCFSVQVLPTGDQKVRQRLCEATVNFRGSNRTFSIVWTNLSAVVIMKAVDKSTSMLPSLTHLLPNTSYI